jgi:hypothetical protein
MNEKSPTLKRDWASFDVVVWLPIPQRPRMIKVEYSIFRGYSRNASNLRGKGWGQLRIPNLKPEVSTSNSILG